MVSIISIKSNKLSGEIFVPGDKSISHRALLLGACAVGKTTIENLLESEDVLATLNALKLLGVNIKKNLNLWEIRGNGLGSLRTPNKILNLGNSGTGARLLMGLVSGCDITASFTGDESLNKRPMKRVIIPLEKDKLVDKAETDVKEVMANYNMGLITNNERYNQIIDIWTHTNSRLTQTLMTQLKNDNQVCNLQIQ